MPQRTVLISGSGGQLGRAFQALDRPDWNLCPLDSTKMDITNWRAVRDTVASVNPDLIIHAAAATNVDRCEREPDWAYMVNALGTRHVAQAAALVNADLVYVSTNYVFNGTKTGAYHEFDATAPISVYGASKLAGERESTIATNRCFIVRTASVFSSGEGNFVATMRRLMNNHDEITVVNDQFSNPTFAPDLAEAIGKITQLSPYGTYHVTNAGTASWHEWASEIQRMTNSSCKVRAIPAIEFTRDAEPPANGTMQSLSLENLGISLPDWRDALERCLQQWPE